MPQEYTTIIVMYALGLTVLFGVTRYRAIFFPAFPRSSAVRRFARLLRITSFSPRLLSYGVIIALMASFLIPLWPVTATPPGWRRWVVFIVAFQPAAAILLNMSIISLYAYNREQRYFQQRRNSSAESIRSLISGDSSPPRATRRTAPPFSLWLRSFETSGQNLIWEDLEVNSRERDVWQHRGAVVVRDISMPLAKSLEPYCPLVAVGGSENALGAGRIGCSAENWRSEVVRLMRNARYILVLPHPTEGLTWEMEQVVRSWDLLEKTLFILPPPPEHGGLHLLDEGVKVWLSDGTRPGQDVNAIARRVMMDLLHELGGSSEPLELPHGGLVRVARASHGGITLETLRLVHDRGIGGGISRRNLLQLLRMT